MKIKRILVIAIGTMASFVIMGCSQTTVKSSEIDTSRYNMRNDTNTPISAKAVVNIEGVIIEVSSDGKSFLLDTGKWVVVNENTKLGITGFNAAPRNEQFFEKSFRVGNSIAGFTLNKNSEKIIAYAIYTNWNWSNPIKK